jgi:hypothetical protein
MKTVETWILRWRTKSKMTLAGSPVQKILCAARLFFARTARKNQVKTDRVAASTANCRHRRGT